MFDLVIGFIVGAFLAGACPLWLIFDVIKMEVEDRRFRKKVASGKTYFGKPIKRFWLS